MSDDPGTAAFWTAERRDILAAYWGAFTAREIAAVIGHGCTRNAVIGKANRLNVPKVPREPVGVPCAPESAPPPEPECELAPDAAKHPNLCRVPDCRHPRQGGRDRCAEHISEAYRRRHPNPRGRLCAAAMRAGSARA